MSVKYQGKWGLVVTELGAEHERQINKKNYVNFLTITLLRQILE